MASWHPYYTAHMPKPQQEADYASDGLFIDLSKARLSAFPNRDKAVKEAQDSFDARAAAYVMACVAPTGGYVPDKDDPLDASKGDWLGPVTVHPDKKFGDDGVQAKTSSLSRDLLELKWYDDWAPEVELVKAKCLAALAYRDYFPNTERTELNALVSQAVLAAGPGWCGTIGPGISNSFDLLAGIRSEGNYDMNQMHLIPMAYRYYDKLYDSAREHLITVLLARGRIRRVEIDDTFTSEDPPNDWSRAGYALPHKRIGETENHMLMMMTTRYLTNQLLYQREPLRIYDNRRNDPSSVTKYQTRRLFGGADGVTATADMAADAPTAGPIGGSCTAILLSMLQSFLRDDFSEYNAKNYQNETRFALLNLCSYAYDHEVRLGARMVLDYISARMAVSSCDLRRLLPFRRKNEGGKVANLDGFMTVDLLRSHDADPMAPFFALQAGNARAFDSIRLRRRDPLECHVHGGGGDQLLDALGDYRLPPSIHDLFLNDSNRRFFQRLHRTVRDDEDATANPHNAENVELYAGSPSYLITAGGQGAGYAIDPYFAGRPRGDHEQQLGVSVTTTFMPTVSRGKPDRSLPDVDPHALNARDLIQFGSFSAGLPLHRMPLVRNYGVGPDFACGLGVYVPDWFKRMGGVLRSDGITPAYEQIGNFTFVDKGSSGDGSGTADRPGFYLALYQQSGMGCLEAFDTWHNPRVSFNQFKDVVFTNNLPTDNGGAFHLKNAQEARWTTYPGTRMRFVIWKSDRNEAAIGAEILEVEEYSAQDPLSSTGDAGNNKDPFLSGTILRSPQDSVVTIANQLMNTTITLDMADHLRPRRTSETGQVEQAGDNNEIWADFDWTGTEHGDACQPFGSLAAALANVADGGLIKIVPSTTQERLPIGTGKAVSLMAPIGGVTIGRA